MQYYSPGMMYFHLKITCMKQYAFPVLLSITLIFLGSCASTTKIYVVRHAEKAGAMSSDPPLTAAGVARAERLAILLKAKHIRHIYSTNTTRTISTAKPLATALGLPVELYGHDTLSFFLSKIKASEKNTLVVGHSNTVLSIVSDLGVKPSIKEIGDGEYDNLFEVRINKTGSKAPRLLEKKY